jgi:hypothetical protein
MSKIKDLKLLKKKWKLSFKHVIIYLNNNNIILPIFCKDILKLLIIFWKSEDSNTKFKLYFDIKEYHSIISGYFLHIEGLKELWSDYIELGLKFRVSLLPILHDN